MRVEEMKINQKKTVCRKCNGHGRFLDIWKLGEFEYIECANCGSAGYLGIIEIKDKYNDDDFEFLAEIEYRKNKYPMKYL